MEKTFFELLQVAIGTRDKLSRVPSAKEWQQLFELSKKQALAAVAFRGLKVLATSPITEQAESSIKGEGANNEGFGTEIGIDKTTYLRWLGLTAKIAQRNKEQNGQCKEICDVLEHDGFHACVLKGQANYDLYPESLRDCRTPGDIDVWVKTKTSSVSFEGGGVEPEGIPIAVSDWDGKGAHYEYYSGKEAVIRYVMMHTPEVNRKTVRDDMRQHHIDYRYFEKTMVEVHFTPSYFQSPLKNRRLQKWFEAHEEDCCTSTLGFKVGSVGFNAVYQLIHVYKHLFTEGIGLRQLLDYYFVLRALHIEQEAISGSPAKDGRPDHLQSMGMWAESIGRSVPSDIEIMHTLGRFGMKRFAGAVMWVLARVFGANDNNMSNACDDDNLCLDDWKKRWPWMICEPNEEAGRFLLDEIMQSGNFGKYDERNRQMQEASKLKRFWLLSKRNWRFFTQYPSEVLWDPYRRAYNVVWRRFMLWKTL